LIFPTSIQSPKISYFKVTADVTRDEKYAWDLSCATTDEYYYCSARRNKPYEKFGELFQYFRSDYHTIVSGRTSTFDEICRRALNSFGDGMHVDSDIVLICASEVLRSPAL
jgi:hypothetical protein